MNLYKGENTTNYGLSHSFKNVPNSESTSYTMNCEFGDISKWYEIPSLKVSEYETLNKGQQTWLFFYERNDSHNFGKENNKK